MTRWKFCAWVGVVALVGLPFNPVFSGVCLVVILVAASNSRSEERHWWER